MLQEPEFFENLADLRIVWCFMII